MLDIGVVSAMTVLPRRLKRVASSADRVLWLQGNAYQWKLSPCALLAVWVEVSQPLLTPKKALGRD